MPNKPRSLLSGLFAKLKQAPKDTAPHLIVEARAGTGKTTTIIEGMKLLMGLETAIEPSPQQRAIWDSMLLSKDVAKSIHFAAFNSSIAKELEQRVPPGTTASTMHSMGLKAVTQVYGRVAINKNRVDDIVLKLLPQFHDVWDLRRKRPGLTGLISQLVSLCKMNLLDGTPTDLYDIMDHHMIEIEDGSIIREAIELVPAVLEKCADVDHDRQIDFDDMIWAPVKNDLDIKRYDLFLGDEVQDWNRCQQALAKKAGHRLILVGDPKQAIYGFAGADCESMGRMMQELSGPTSEDFDPNEKKVSGFRSCVVLPLTVTRRCGKAIVAEAQKIVPDFEAHETCCDGSVGRANMVGGDNYYGGYVQDGDMILCRLNAPLVSECFKFLKAGRKATIIGRDIGQGLIGTIKKTKATKVSALAVGIGHWLDGELIKENAKKHPSEERKMALTDRHDCLACFCDGLKPDDPVELVIQKVEMIFTDRVTIGIRLGTVHRVKGLESRRVFIIQTSKSKMPHPMAKTPWQLEQEWNIKYIAITRAVEELVWVDGGDKENDR